ncbi:hypothetical protein [Bradyrhizobium sp. 2S1]|uniref:hypothetical protein n=1 Tax=Bradyrhizobium sp. 2S1 TaxID=1404429 RepID=UPI00140AB929|nr:hypothetical protein [Bradyrhizobium sp. 2S1]MCK7674085.1 hypothetical protein [Bradyrhizobium sp. 2S1]
MSALEREADQGQAGRRGRLLTWLCENAALEARYDSRAMKRFIEGADRGQSTLFPECVEARMGATH